MTDIFIPGTYDRLVTNGILNYDPQAFLYGVSSPYLDARYEKINNNTSNIQKQNINPTNISKKKKKKNNTFLTILIPTALLTAAGILIYKKCDYKNWNIYKKLIDSKSTKQIQKNTDTTLKKCEINIKNFVQNVKTKISKGYHDVIDWGKNIFKSKPKTP